MRTLKELIDIKDPAWPLIQKWISEATNEVKILSANKHQAEKVLLDVQVTTKSPLGAIAYLTGGILFDNGWLRFLGSGHNELSRNISNWNQIDKTGKASKLEGCLLIADDVVGGFFAINGGLFEGETGEVFYLAPDTLEWESLEMGYSDFLYWACTGDLQQYYETFRWADWQQEVQTVNGSQGVLIYPHLWAEGDDINMRSRSIVSIEELWNLNMMYKAKLG